MLFPLKYTNEDANKTIQTFMNDQLMPVLDELEMLALAILRFRIDTLGLFRRYRLAKLENEYREKSKRFLTLYHIYTNPEKLFADLKLDAQKDVELIQQLRADYENSKILVSYHVDRGFRMVELLQEQLDRYHRSADQRMAVVLSILAIATSVVSIIITHSV